jgi:hypothetical protein
MTGPTERWHLLSARRLIRPRRLQCCDTTALRHSDTPADAPTPPIAGAVPLLSRLDPATTPAHRLFIEAAIAHSQITADPDIRLAWARYAHSGGYQLHGPYDPTTRRAALLYAQALTEHGNLRAAYRLHRHRLAVAQLLAQPDEVITAHRYLAEACHNIGQCVQAVGEVHHALALWHAHRQPTGEGHQIVASYAVILAGCGQAHTAWRTLRTYPDLLPDTASAISVLARRIATVQTTHPPICRRPTHQPPAGTTSERAASWDTGLHQLTFRQPRSDDTPRTRQ